MKHQYAEILQAIADGKQIQWQDGEGDWINEDWPTVLYQVSNVMYRKEHYRVKPETITFNGFELPAPYMGKLEMAQTYYYPSTGLPSFYDMTHWIDDCCDKQHQKRGLVFLTKEDAIAWGKAMCPIKQE